MKKRILTGWNFRRIIYAVSGTIIIISSISAHEWAGVLFGACFASMGIFSFGCASGNCSANGCAPDFRDAESEKEVNYIEVK